MGFAPIAPSIQSVAQSSAKQNRQPGQPGSESRNEEGREKDAGRQVRNQVRPIAMESQCGDRPPPFSRKDRPRIRDTAIDPLLGRHLLGEVKPTEQPSGNKEGELRDRPSRRHFSAGGSLLL